VPPKPIIIRIVADDADCYAWKGPDSSSSVYWFRPDGRQLGSPFWSYFRVTGQPSGATPAARTYAKSQSVLGLICPTQMTYD
jgi:hypothetical protein